MEEGRCITVLRDLSSSNPTAARAIIPTNDEMSDKSLFYDCMMIMKVMRWVAKKDVNLSSAQILLWKSSVCFLRPILSLRQSWTDFRHGAMNISGTPSILSLATSYILFFYFIEQLWVFRPHYVWLYMLVGKSSSLIGKSNSQLAFADSRERIPWKTKILRKKWEVFCNKNMGSFNKYVLIFEPTIPSKSFKIRK